MKVKSFVGSIVLFVVSAALSALTYALSDSIANSEGLGKAISLLALIPLLIIFFLLLISSLISGTVASISAITSDVKAIKIIAIIILILYVGLIVFNTLLALKVFGNL